MEKSATRFKFTITHLKILETVEFLNKKHYYPLPHGVRKILIGEEDEETIKFKDAPTFGTLISYPDKKISRYVMMLQRYHYLDKKYDVKTNELYLSISDLGIATILEYKKKHKVNYKKKTVNKEITIVNIE
ncbi:MAG: hypothetical protein K5906_01255 [Bacilli bacterium]|nr:hypothetical protein [Bacilli bacterium]